MNDRLKSILADPQTSGGLLVCVDEGASDEFESFAENLGFQLKPYGKLTAKKEKVIEVR